MYLLHNVQEPKPRHVAVKEVVLPFNKFPGADTLLGPEMRSTGEVMGIDYDFASSYAKAQIAAGQKLPMSGACGRFFDEVVLAFMLRIDVPAATQRRRWLQGSSCPGQVCTAMPCCGFGCAADILLLMLCARLSAKERCASSTRRHGLLQGAFHC
jgi:hypothetical protein